MPIFRFSITLIVVLLTATFARAGGGTIILKNDHIEVTVDPAKGLITGFNLPGQANTLWVNPKPISDPNRNNGWVNYGGDKLWWGPMIDWMSVKGRRLPPDEALDTDWKVIKQTPDQVVIRSGVSPWVGIRGERKISLSPDSSEIVIRNRFIRVQPSEQRLQLWTISQLPPPLWVLLDSHPREGEAPFVNRRPQFDPLPYISIMPETGGVRYRYNADGPNMIGTRGSWIAAIYDDFLIIHQIHPEPEADYATDVSVQLFSIKGFVELETLSPNATPAVGESMSNTVRWHVLPRPAELSDHELAVWIGERMNTDEFCELK